MNLKSHRQNLRFSDLKNYRRCARSWREVFILCVSVGLCGCLYNPFSAGSSNANSNRAAARGSAAENQNANITATLRIEKRIKQLQPSEIEISSVGGTGSEINRVGDTGGETSNLNSELSTSQVAQSELQVSQTLSELNATQTDQGIVINLPENILFDFDKAEIKPEAEATLGKIRDLLNYYKETPMQINGHTDNKGSDAYNLKLSERRAAAVKTYLTDRFGVSGARLTANGLGENRPVAPNEKSNGADDPEGRQKNRRVEVILENAQTPGKN